MAPFSKAFSDMTVSDTAIVAEIISIKTQDCLGHLALEEGENPQPGSPVTVDGKTYTVLERRHRYQYRGGQYRLHRVLLAVNGAEEAPPDRHWFEGRWVIGDVTCRFNARSELLRCALHPVGPCDGCSAREALA